MPRVLLYCLVVMMHIAGTCSLKLSQSMPWLYAQASGREKFAFACLLKPKPTFATTGHNRFEHMQLANNTAQVVTYMRDAATLQEHEHQCSCDDVHELQSSIAKMQDNNRDLCRRVQRLEYVLAELLETMQTSDDMAFLEKQTCSSVIYNSELTRPRSLRLLRSGLKDLQKKWAF